MKNKSIIAKNITKEYRLFSNKKNKLVEIVKERNKRNIMRAVEDISFELQEGECLGLLGLNGSGKSTLSNIISGLVEPTYGEIKVNGEVASISVSVGLNGNLTGLENIEYKGLLLGFSPLEIKNIIPKIIDFADIGEYIYQPVKYYSSGMRARLGFSISINVEPDVLVIDEGLSVGDSSFSDKCLTAMNEYRKNGKTIIFVSHSINQIKEFCTKSLWLEYGKLKAFGNVVDIVKEYNDFLIFFNKLNQEERNKYKESKIRNSQ